MLGFTLRSGETLPVYWIPSDPNDVTLYYPRSVFINALTGDKIATLDLVKQANGSYTAQLLVPNDPTNLGFYIVETLNVYTDSDHTTLTNTYEQEQRTHKIKNETQNYGGASVDNTDYNYIEKVVKRIIDEAIATIKFEQKEVDFKPLLEKVEDITKSHKKVAYGLNKGIKQVLEKEIDFPKGEYMQHFVAVVERMEDLDQKLEKLQSDIPSMKDYIENKHNEDHEAIKFSHNEIKDKFNEHLQDIRNEIAHQFEGVDHLAYSRDYKVEKKEKEEDKMTDLLKGLI